MRRIFDWLGANPMEVTISVEFKQTLRVPLRGVIVSGLVLVLLGIGVLFADAFAPRMPRPVGEVRAPPAHATPTPWRGRLGIGVMRSGNEVRPHFERGAN